MRLQTTEGTAIAYVPGERKCDPDSQLYVSNITSQDSLIPKPEGSVSPLWTH